MSKKILSLTAFSIIVMTSFSSVNAVNSPVDQAVLCKNNNTDCTVFGNLYAQDVCKREGCIKACESLMEQFGGYKKDCKI